LNVETKKIFKGVLAMKSYREYLWVNTKNRREYINITSQVEEVIRKSSVREGLVLVNPMHITASCYINDDEPGLIRDFDRFLEKVAPYDPQGYEHNKTGEDNGHTDPVQGCCRWS